MNKADFLSELATKLRSLTPIEIDSSLAFYSEIIDDRMEDGLSEEEAVRGLGNIEEIAREAMIDATSLTKLIIPSKTFSKSDIILLILCSPLIVALFALIFAFYATVWLLIVSLFLIELCFILAGIAGIVASIVDIKGNIPISILLFFGGAISICIGIFTFSPIKMVSKKLMGLTTWFLRNIKSLLLRKR